MCSSLEAQAIIRFKYLLLSQSETAFGNCNAAVVEEFHQLHKCKFTVLAVHCVNLSIKVFSELTEGILLTDFKLYSTFTSLRMRERFF